MKPKDRDREPVIGELIQNMTFIHRCEDV
jgi:hypothetical protein